MSLCPNPKCGAPRLKCRMGEESPSDCAIWTKGGGGAPAAPNGDDSPLLMRLPWSGAALGTAGLAFLTGRGEPKLVALMGPHNAGKTTLLGLFYQQVGRSGQLGDARFAGSYSLEGWESIAHALRWESNVPRFPPHTSSGGGRIPGLLHFAMRDDAGVLSDVLLADGPGEWFQRWAIDPAADDAEGARWLVERASAILVVADCAALAGAERGQARSDTIQLLRRVAAERRDRPVALAWTKADIEVPPLIRDAVSTAAATVMPDIVMFETSVVPFERDNVSTLPGPAVTRLLGWMISPLPRGFELPEPRPSGADPFFAIGVAA